MVMATSRSNDEFDDELLSAYVDGELTAAERALVEERLRADERARRLVADLRAASEAVKALPRVALGRDLAASVLAEIERKHPHVESAAVLAMPQLEEERRAARGRGLVWAAVAIAAALMLMVLRPADAPHDAQQLAQSSSDKRIEADEPADLSKAPGRQDLDRGGATPMAAAPAAAESAQSGGTTRATRERSELMRKGATEGAQAAASAASEPTAPSAARAAATSERAVDDADAAPTIEVAVSGEFGPAEFQSLLAANGIVMSDEPLPENLRAVLSLEGSLARADGEEALGRDAGTFIAGVEAIVVEATPAELESVIAAIRTAAPGALPAGELLKKTADEVSRGGGGGFGGGGRGGRAALEARQLAASQAWRLTVAPPTEEALAETLDGAAAGEAAAEDASIDAARGGRRSSGLGGAASPTRTRVLFLLRNVEDRAGQQQ
jgi:anti-sigma factor RsiW